MGGSRTPIIEGPRPLHSDRRADHYTPNCEEPFFIHSGNTHEVQEYLTLGEHHIYVTSTLMNADFLAGLPDDVRRTVETTVDELEAWSFDVQADMNAEAIAAMRDSDIEVVELTEDERETFREISLPVRDQYGELFGPDAARILSTLVDEVEQAERGRS